MPALVKSKNENFKCNTKINNNNFTDVRVQLDKQFSKLSLCNILQDICRLSTVPTHTTGKTYLKSFEMLTFPKATAISNVPIVSMLEAIIGIP